MNFRKLFRHLSYKTNLIIVLIIVLIPVFIFSSLWIYTNSKTSLESEFEQSIVGIEYEISNSIKLVDEGWKIFEQSLEQDMIAAFPLFLEAYNNSGQNPALMNLTALRSEIGHGYDLYVIDASGVIIATTYETDLHLDFSIVAPTFYSTLTEIRKGDQFVSDRITTETLTGILRKFAYIPTPDHKYILELGLESDEFAETIEELNYLRIAEELIPLDPYLEKIRIFDHLAYQEGLSDFTPSSDLYDIVRSVYLNKTNFEYSNQTSGLLLRYIYVNLTDSNYPSDISKIVEITFNHYLLQENLIEMRIQFIIINLSIGAIILGIALIISKIFTHPINEIVHGVDVIAKGNLNYVIPTRTQTELQSLVDSINIMVRERKRIDDALAQERVVLKKSLDDKEILLKEIHHRVKNNLQIISSLARLQKTRDFSPEMIQHNKDFQNRIQIMAMIHEILYGSDDMEFINLNQYVHRLVDFLFRSFQISNEIVTLKMEIDDIHLNLDQGVLCGIVINEIITNTLKYAFSDTVPVKIISISIQKKLNGEIHLLIGDNGIGLPTNFELSTSKTLGMQLIHGLSNQLGGKIEMLRENGLVYEISFQLNKA